MKTFYSFLYKNLTVERISILIILVLYVYGIIGITAYSSKELIKLTPAILMFGSFLVFVNTHRSWLNYLYLFFLILFGFCIELIGVKTGSVFGWYKYGNNLGIKWLDVPLIMGLNWMSLMYGASMIAFWFSSNKILQWLCSAFFMLIIDIFIEPVACKLDFWCWHNGVLPPQNFIAWFIASFFLSIPFTFLKHDSETRFAGIYFLIQLCFFIVLNFHYTGI